MAGSRRPGPSQAQKSFEFRNQTNTLLEKANSHLSNGQPNAAIKIYTTLITKFSPAHPIVFLNRALAHLALDFPELAVSDAYNAKLAVQEIRERFYKGFRSHSLQAVISYMKVCERASDQGADWATEPTCYLRGAELDVEAASIGLDVPGYKKADKNEKTYVLLWELETKANYRLALGLWKVGGGARMDAIDILSKGAKLLLYVSEDREAFDDLGNHILEDLNREMYAEDMVAKAQGITSKDEREAFRMAGIRGECSHKQTLIKRQLHPENTFEPDLEGKGIPKLFVDQLQRMAPNTHLQVIKSSGGKLARLVLVASQDIYPGDIVLQETSAFHVMTSSLDFDTNAYCHTCATTLLGSPSKQNLLRSRTGKIPPNPNPDYPDESPTEKNTSVSTSFRTEDISDNEDPLIPSQMESFIKEPSPPLSPSSSRTVRGKGPSSPSGNANQQALNPNPAIYSPPERPCLCMACHAALYCSEKCRNLAAKESHTRLCDTGIEDYIRSQVLLLRRAAAKRVTPGLRDSKGWTEPEEQCLRELLLARILAIAVRKGLHPLELDIVRILGGGEWKIGDLKPVYGGYGEGTEEFESMDSLSNECVSEGSFFGSNEKYAKEKAAMKDMPWSFTSNVENPYHMLDSMKSNPLKDTHRFDGWVINTLMAKIEHNMRITKGARTVKIINNAKLKSQEAAYNEKGKEDVWVGSLHPVMSLVQKEVKEVIRGRGNVIIKEMGKGIIRLIAVARDSTTTHDEGIGASFYELDKMDIAPSFNDSAIHSSQPNSAPEPAIKKGDLIILKSESTTDPTMLYGNAKQNGVQAWLDDIGGAERRHGVKVLDGSGRVEEQSFYDGVIGARAGMDLS